MKSINVLLVSQSLHLREILERDCVRWGFDVALAMVWQRASIKSAFSDKAPAVVVIYLGTDENDCLSILTQLRLISQSTKVIVVIDSLQPDFYKRAIAVGANEILDKSEMSSVPRTIVHELQLYQLESTSSLARTTIAGAVLKPLANQNAPKLDSQVLHEQGSSRSLYIANLLPMLIIDLDTLYVLEVNDAAVSKYGYSRDELHHMTIYDLCPHEDAARWTQWSQTLLQRGLGYKWSDEGRHRLKSGVIIDVDVTAHTIEFQGRWATHIVVIDITDSIKAKSTIEVNERRYRAIVETQTELINRVTPQGQITFSNEAFRRFVGQSAEGSTDFNFLQAVHPDDRVLLRNHLLSLTPANPTATITHRMMRADGYVRWYEWVSQVIYDEAGRLQDIQGIGRDITEAKLMEAELRSSEEKYRSLVESSDSALALIAADGQVLFANVIAATALGMTTNDMIGRNMIDLFPPQIAKRQLDHVKKVIQTGRGAIADTSSVAAGESHWYHTSIQPVHNENGQVYAAFINATDIDNLVRTSESLQISEEKYRRIVETAQEGLWAVDGQVRTTHVNEKMAAMLDYSPEELVGKPFLNFIHPDDRRIDDDDQHVFAAITTHHDMRLVRRNGDVVWTVISTYCSFTVEGQFDGGLATVTNITERRLALLAVQHSARRLEMLHQLDLAIMRAEPIENIAHMALDALWELIPCQTMMVAGVDESTLTCQCLATRYDTAPFLRQGESRPINEQQFVYLLHDDFLVIDIDPGQQTRYDILPESENSDTSRILYIPLKADNVLVGLLRMTTNDVGQFNNDHITIAQEIARPIAIAMRQTELTQRVHRYTEELEHRITERTLALQQVNERLSTTLRSSSDAVLLAGLADGIEDANPAFGRLFSCAPDEYTHHAIMDLAHEDSKASLQVALNQARRGIATDQLPIMALRRDGSWFDAEIGIAPVFAGDGDANAYGNPRVVCVLRDITARVKAEQALRDSEERFRSLIEAAPQAYIIADASGKMILVNAQAEIVFGFQRTELIGNHITMLIPDRFHHRHEPHILDLLEQVRARTPQTGLEMVGRQANGCEIPVELYISSLSTLSGRVFIGAIADITWRKKANEQMAFQSSLLQSVGQPLVAIRNDGTITYWNKHAERLYGWTELEALGRKVDELVTIQGQMPLSSISELLSTGTLSNWTGELLVAGKNNSIKPVLITTTVVSDTVSQEPSTITVGVDLTERKLMEQKLEATVRDLRASEAQLRSNEERLRVLFENNPDALILTDLKHILHQANHAFEELVGRPMAEMQRHDYLGFNFLKKESIEILDTASSQAMSGHTPSPVEIEINALDGRLIPVTARCYGVSVLDERFLLIALHDITTQKRAEAEWLNSIQQQTELNELKTRFVSMASHEYRTPLATIMVITESLLAYRERMTDIQIENRLQKIRREVTQMTEIINGVLQLSRVQAGRMKLNPVIGDLGKLCSDVIDTYNENPATKRHVIMHCDEGLAPIAFDPHLMWQIVSNLISNALKYTAPDKTVYVSVTDTPTHMILMVEDEGIGIPVQDQKHLFEPFHRAANVGQTTGTGLGLSITKYAVEMHSGTITFESEVGRGTSFTVTLPHPPPDPQ